jgi:hypothetical protein
MSPRVTLKRSFDFEFGSGKPPTPAGNHSFTEEQMKHIAVPGLMPEIWLLKTLRQLPNH